MATTSSSSASPSVFPATWTAADMLESLGGIPLERIRMVPPPGMATVEDVIRIEAQENRICELVDGILVEKPMGYYESHLAMMLGHLIQTYLDANDLGILVGESGFIKILPGQVRAPDLAFFGWDRFPQRELPRDPVPGIAPDLAIEILSKTNTKAEMRRKLREYFEAGARLVWLIDPKVRTATCYSSVEQSTLVHESDSLQGGAVLPGFELRLQDLFARAGRQSTGE